jgi:hypothetical protein
MCFGALACALLLFGVVAGCKTEPEKQLVEMRDPPAFGSTPEVKTMQAFVVGKWGVKDIIDPNLVKNYHMEGIATQEAEEGVTDYFTFKGDGTFICRLRNFGPKIEGKWTVNDQALTLSFDTIDGQPTQSVMDEVHKDEETGAQAAIPRAMAYDGAKSRIDALTSWRLGKDLKTFTIPDEEGAMGVGGDGNTLVRMLVQTKE